MTDEEFEKEVKDLTAMLRNLRLIKDKGHKKKFKAIIRAMLISLMKED